MQGIPTKIKFRGKTYKNFTELSSAFNLTDGCVRARLKRGWSLEEALGFVFRKSDSPGRDKEIEVNKKVYKSIKIACKALNVKNYYTVAQRLNKYNYTNEQAFGLEPPPQKKPSNAIKISIGKKTFNSKKEAANYHNVSQRLVITRLNRGWTVEEAYEIKIRSPNKDKIFDQKGKKKKGYIYLITNKYNQKQYVGITINPIKDRFNSHIYLSGPKNNKDSLEYAIWKFGKNQFSCKKIKKTFVDKLGFFERFYIKKFKTLNPKGYNINKGGAGIFGGVRYKIPIFYENLMFFSLSDLARYKKILPSTLGARVRRGMSIKNAIETKFRKKIN